MSSNDLPYFTGRTPAVACQADQRFSYCLYVPKAAAQSPQKARMLVAIHDTLRNNQTLRDSFIELAESTRTIVVAPLFPAGIEDPANLDNYKYLRYRGIRFDELVLAMTAEVAARYGVSDARFMLFGFSGGAHFAHRFLYVHPSRLSAVVAAAPGSVTLPTEDYAWWPGLRGFPEIFGKPVDWAALRRVPTHLVVGALDTDPGGIVQSKDHPNWIDGAAAAGTNRVERLRTLHAALKAHGASVSFEELAGAGHELGPVAEAAVRFLRGLPQPPA